MSNITVSQAAHVPVSQQWLECVERKGLGHPDSICDALVESVANRLCASYLDHFGRILHFNLDKALLVAGQTQPAFGGGLVERPMRLVLGDRATSIYDGKSIPLNEIVTTSVAQWFSDNLSRIVPTQHVVIQNEIQPGSAELAGIFARNEIVANDTSAAVGYAPLSPTEQLVLDAERWLNSPATKQRFPAVGEDVKVMALRKGNDVELTVAVAFVDRHITSASDYSAQKAAVRDALLAHLTDLPQCTGTLQLQLNTLDDPQRGLAGIYLTVLGTSAECGDCGEVGRGNNVRGIISLLRPATNEAAAGKNPISHVGKIYNLLSHQIAQRIYDSLEAVDEVYVWLVSRIGGRLDEPWCASASMSLKPDAVLSDVEKPTRDIIAEELSQIDTFCNQLIRGKLAVC